MIVALLLVGCEKFTIDTTYDISCTTTMVDGEEAKITPDVVSYIFYLDKLERDLYAPASYEEALSGKISLITDINKSREVNITGRYDAATGIATLPNITNTYVIFVLCDTENKIYAYREYEIGNDLPLISTSILFQPFLFTGVDTEISERGWIFNKSSSTD